MRHDRHHYVQIEIAVSAGPGDTDVVPKDLCANHHHRFAHHWIYFTGHDRAAGLSRRQLDLADAAPGTTPEEADIVCDLEQTYRDRFELTTSFNHGVLAALRLKMVFRF